MKTIILAGGWGSRLGSLSQSIPKPMVKIGGKPILWHIMKTYSTFGFNEFIISCGVKAHVIKNYFANYESFYQDFTVNMKTQEIEYHNHHGENNWNVTLVDTGLNTLKGARIKRVEKYLNKDINMVTYGDGVADINIKKLVKELNLEEQVLFLRNISQDLKNALVAKSNIFVMPSIVYKKSVEGFGIAYVEAAQYGVPSIGGKDGGASDAIKDKETGIICDGNNLDEIYSSIDLVLKNNSYKELGKKAKDYVTKFEWNNIVNEYLKIL